jgi:putative phosphoesterase
MRVAVLADIHGNLPALEAVLAEINQLGVDRLVLNGDIAAGPLAGETLDRLAELGDRAIWVHGNGERGLDAGFDHAADPTANEHDLEVGRLLSRSQRDRLVGLPTTVTMQGDGLGTVLCCHATPRRDDEMLLVDSPPSRYAETLAGVSADVVVLGHTHMPFDRLHDQRRVVNPGSVGMPYGHAGAAWALLGPAWNCAVHPTIPRLPRRGSPTTRGLGRPGGPRRSSCSRPPTPKHSRCPLKSRGTSSRPQRSCADR